MAADKDNLHQGHRDRLKQRALAEGLDNFEEHQVLELLLFYAMPYRDVNDLAHRLLEHFGSFTAVLDADYEHLLRVPGVGPNIALLLTLLPEFFRRYQLGKQSARTRLNSLEEAARYGAGLFIGVTREQFYVICLDHQRQVIKAALINEGTVGRVEVSVRRVVEAALRYRAAGVILAHNHPTAAPRPSAQDVELTKSIASALAAIDVAVYDHVVVAGDKYLSFCASGLMKNTYDII